MGELLKSWLETEGPKIQTILLGKPTADPNSRPQPSGATTFPVPDPGEPPPAGEEALANIGGQAAPGAETQMPPSWVPPTQQSPAPTGGGPAKPGAQPAFGGQQSPAPTGAQSTAPAPPPTDGKKPTSFDDVMAAVTPEQVEGGIKTIEAANKGKSIDQIYYEATGDEGGQLSRQQKGQLLMEFGLNLLAQSGPGGPGDQAAFGEAGLKTLDRYQEMRKSNIEHPKRAIEGIQDFEVKSAQIEKYLRGPLGKSTVPQIKQDKNGNWITIDPMTSTSKPIIDAEGNPVAGKPGAAGGRTLDFEVKRSAYEALYCEGLSGKALAACQRKGFEVALSGDTDDESSKKNKDNRVKIGMEVLKNIADPDSPARYPKTMPDGTTKKVKWKDLSDTEQEQILNTKVGRTVEILTGSQGGAEEESAQEDASENGEEPGSFDEQPGGGGNTFDEQALDLSEEDFNAIPEGKTALLDDGTKVRKQDGQLIRVQ